MLGNDQPVKFLQNDAYAYKSVAVQCGLNVVLTYLHVSRPGVNVSAARTSADKTVAICKALLSKAKNVAVVAEARNITSTLSCKVVGSKMQSRLLANSRRTFAVFTPFSPIMCFY